MIKISTTAQILNAETPVGRPRRLGRECQGQHSGRRSTGNRGIIADQLRRLRRRMVDPAICIQREARPIGGIPIDNRATGQIPACPVLIIRSGNAGLPVTTFSTADCYSTAKGRSEEHTSELQSLMRISYAVFCLKKKKHNK